MPTMLSPQFSSRVHSPRFGEAAPSTPTPPNTPAHSAHSEAPVAEDKFHKEESDSKASTPTHTPPASPPPGKVAHEHAPEGAEKPKSEKQEILEHLANMDKKGMKPVFMLFAPKDDQVKTKPGSPQHEKTKWDELSPAKKFVLTVLAPVIQVVNYIVMFPIYIFLASISWLFGNKHKQAENNEAQTQVKPKHDKTKENTTEKTKPAPQHELKHAAAVTKPEVVAKKDEPTAKE